MNRKALKTLEYDKIINKLTEYAASPMGKELCRDLLPYADLEEIRQMQRETSDALSRIFSKGNISFSGTRAIRGSLMRLTVGSVLNREELLGISSVLNVVSRVKSYSRKESAENMADSLDGYQRRTRSTPHGAT